MCLENKRVFDVCNPGMSTARGRLLYEIPESIFQVNIVTLSFCCCYFCFVVVIFVLLCFVVVFFSFCLEIQSNLCTVATLGT